MFMIRVRASIRVRVYIFLGFMVHDLAFKV